MADVTLTADTLYSDIDADLADGDRIYCDGYRLTIDMDVTKSIYYRPNKGGEIYCQNTSTDTIRYINSASGYYFDVGDGDGKITMEGDLMTLGTVDANGQLVVSIPTDMTRLFAVYVPSLSMWFFEKTDYGSYVDNNYILSTKEKPLFSYDSDTQTITFDYKPLTEGTEIQFTNIVIHRDFSIRASYNKLYLENHYWNAKGILIYAPFMYQNKSDDIKYFEKSIFIQNDTPYKTIRNIYMTNCALGCTSYYYGAIRAQNTQNLNLSNCTIYPRWQWGGWNYDVTIDNCKLIGDFTNDAWTFSLKNLKITNSEIYTGRTLVPTDSRNTLIENCTFRSSEDPEYAISSAYRTSFRAAGNNEVFVIKGCSFVPASGNLFNSTYLNGNYFVAIECTKTDTSYWNYGLIGNLRFFNNISDTPDDSLIPIRTSDGSSFMPNHLIVGHRGDCKILVDRPGAAVLDFRNGIENTNATYEATFNAYDSDNSSWVMFFKRYGDDIIGERIYEITDLFHNFWDDVETFDSYEKYNTYNVDFRFSYNGTDWYIWDDFVALSVPTVVNLYVKVIATNGTTVFNGIKFYYTRKSTWVEYPNVWRDRIIIMTQFFVMVPMNTALYHSRWNDIIDRKVSNGNTVDYIVWYDDVSNWYTTIKVRKYGYEFGELTANEIPEFKSNVYYIGKEKTDLTMTETDASNVNGVVLQTSSDTDYTWELDCGNNTLEDTYHYIQYKLTNYGEMADIDVFLFNEFLLRDGDKFKTVWIRDNEGVKLINYSGKVSSMQKDDGSLYIPPETIQFSFSLNPAITNYEYRIYQVDSIGSLTGAVELQGEESATSSSQTYTYTYDGTDIPIAVQIISQPDNDYIESVTYYTLSNVDQDVIINLEKDENN